MTHPTPPRAVIFDVGNVLVGWRPERVYEDLIPDPAIRAALFARVDFDAMNLRGDRDGRLADEVAALAARHPDDAPAIIAWHDRWAEMFSPPIPQSFALLATLKAAGVRVVALTNFAADTWDRAGDIYPALTTFDDAIVSGREGTVKPERRIYEILERRTGLSGADLFFTDDRADNIAAAAARGWRTHMFEGPDGLATALRAEGLPV
ncbi:MAG: 2-haloacid dehalogenase [Paracoccaceae bacterium]|jgi:2-haloacid dehalogenase